MPAQAWAQTPSQPQGDPCLHAYYTQRADADSGPWALHLNTKDQSPAAQHPLLFSLLSLGFSCALLAPP